MMVPRMQFIWLCSTVLLPAGFIAAWTPNLTGVAVAATLLLLFVSGLDVLASRPKLQPFEIILPDVTRLTVDQKSHLKLAVKKPLALTAILRIGLSLPPEITSNHKDFYLNLSTGADHVVLSWPVIALRRGRFAVTRCHLEIKSYLGLWAVRRVMPLDSEIRAYPNLVTGQYQIRGLFRRKEWGLRTQRRVGRGREFEQLREYLPGDSFEDIDWKATARRRYPITKIYQVEQSQEIYVLVDASRLSTRSATYIMDRRRCVRSDNIRGEITIFERYITAALVMAVIADQLSDRFGLLIFSDKPEGFIKAGRGQAHYNACRDALYNRMPYTVSPDFDELFTFVGTHLRKRALLVVLTSLDDPMLAESFIHAMGGAARQHVLMVNMFRPPGAHPLFSDPDVHQVQGIYQHLVGHMLWSSINETRRQLKQHGAALHLLDKDQLCSQLMTQYMEVKQRQVL